MTAQQPAFCKVLKLERWAIIFSRLKTHQLDGFFFLPLMVKNKFLRGIIMKKRQSHTQIFLSVKKDFNLSLKSLLSLGYKNPANLKENSPIPVPQVLCIDLTDKDFFPVNVTCLAASCSSGKKPIIHTYPNVLSLLK